MRIFRRIRGLVWMARHFGVAATIRYERDRRKGATIARARKHFDLAPWEKDG